MTNWQIEVGRMTLYILFPIGVYYYFNQSESIEKWMTNERKRYDITNSKEHMDFLQFVENFNDKQRLKQITEMEAEYNKMKMT